MTISVLIADDQELIRTGLTMILDAQPDIEVIGQASDGIEATRRITRLVPGSKVLMLTTFDLDEYVYAALRAGASGFLLKDAPPADLLSAIRSVAAGDAVVAPPVFRPGSWS